MCCFWTFTMSLSVCLIACQPGNDYLLEKLGALKKKGGNQNINGSSGGSCYEGTDGGFGQSALPLMLMLGTVFFPLWSQGPEKTSSHGYYMFE